MGPIFFAFGSALGESVFAFPLAYWACQSLRPLPPLRVAWKPWGLFLFLRAVSIALYGAPEQAPAIGVVAFFAVPVCTAVFAILALASWDDRKLQKESAVNGIPRPTNTEFERPQLNWRRGLIRVWIVLGVGWCAFVAVSERVPAKVAYAWNYDTTRSWERNPYLDAQAATQVLADQQVQTSRAALAVAGASSVNADRAAQNQKLAARYKVPANVVDQFPEEFRQRALTENAASATDPVISEMKLEREMARLGWSPIAKPDWNWLPEMVLPPTLGVGLLIVAVWIVRQVARWVWRGFSDT